MHPSTVCPCAHHTCLVASDSSKVGCRVSDALQALARRLRSFPGGDFEPSPPPHLLDDLTDELLVAASDAVAVVAAEVTPRVAGRARYRLLAWTVADARGAQQPLSKAEAETVGKRLEAQAKRTREALAEITAFYKQARADCHMVWALPAEPLGVPESSMRSLERMLLSCQLSFRN